MATVTVSIGATGRDYATIAAFVADLDNDTPFDAGDDVIGELYADGDFAERIQLNTGDTLGLNSITLRPAAGEGHDGTPNSGVRVLWGSNGLMHSFGTTGVPITIEGIDFDANGADINGPILTCGSGTSPAHVHRCLVHNVTASRTATPGGIYHNPGGSPTNFTNNVIFNINNSNTGGVYGIAHGTDAAAVKVYNNTVTGLACTSSGNAWAFNQLGDDVAVFDYKNNLCTDITSTSGSAGMLSEGNAPVNIVHSNNGTDDTSSPDSGLRNLSITFNAAGSDDYSLAAGDTDAIDAGTDLGAGVWAEDAVFRDRDTEGDTWDLGAFEYVSTGTDITGVADSFTLTPQNAVVTATSDTNITGVADTKTLTTSSLSFSFNINGVADSKTLAAQPAIVMLDGNTNITATSVSKTITAQSATIEITNSFSPAVIVKNLQTYQATLSGSAFPEVDDDAEFFLRRRKISRMKSYRNR